MILFARNPSAKVPCGVVNLWRFRLDFCKPKQYSRFEVDEYKWNFGGWISIFSVWWTVFFFLRAHYVFYSRFEFFFFFSVRVQFHIFRAILGVFWIAARKNVNKKRILFKLNYLFVRLFCSQNCFVFTFFIYFVILLFTFVFFCCNLYSLFFILIFV